MEECDDPLTGRSCVGWPAAIGLTLLLSGFQKLAGFGATVMGQEGLFFLLGASIVAIVVECVGGVALVLGYQTRLTGAVLAVWYIATALAAHADFTNTDQVILFLQNVAMAGGFLQLKQLKQSLRAALHS
jgi:putative oxidoreductase